MVSPPPYLWGVNGSNHTSLHFPFSYLAEWSNQVRDFEQDFLYFFFSWEISCFSPGKCTKTREKPPSYLFPQRCGFPEKKGMEGKSRAGDYFISPFVAAGFLFVVFPGNALVLCQKKAFSGAIIGKQKSNQIHKKICVRKRYMYKVFWHFRPKVFSYLKRDIYIKTQA